MQAIMADSKGQLTWQEVTDVAPREGEVLIKVSAAGVNRADLLQAAGKYPPPPGASEIIGLEVSGTVARLGDGVTGWDAEQPVCALLAGGGYAEYVAVPAEQVMPIPETVELHEAAALPEVACTVWSNLVMTAGLRAGQLVLVHGGASGIGTHAIQVAGALGNRVAVTAGAKNKLELCAELGAEITIGYRDEDFVERVRTESGGAGADVILDIMGASYLDRNIDALAPDGRLVIIGMQGGIKGELNIAKLLGKRAGVIATALRSRPVSGPGSKADIVTEVVANVWPMIADGQVRPIIGAEFGIEQAGAAHELLESGEVSGKVVLRVAD
ncbi:putative NAD(P)H quinone oxidoreductase, PIG3 family [Mycolicibacterium rhodesiae NBB3]|jgi:putative PIG3 family NAD(P)H quinone oxidoreductase|uniref:Putative NAD(P)H quinone oxidoreductase, PIG3 family n=1 Tax=Mycolicibacterium rhodesiae (strain NBB3) TaxID=710685 RepID=G8RPL5_MYCRN|nr:NAD(P)H-quinone oxidoreductase [Mycolicibacterium rhodesiae]AEV72578.1 putative NAD(P)H quinone oxidoreductase, PIG3 family [Mycolicibacterium rhodesiae NBB3]